MTAITTTNGNDNAAPPKITLYTSHFCPYAHRAHIVLEELKLPYEEVIIDLEQPRPQWYLDLNPRGLVPTIKYSVPGKYDEEIITESTIVTQFLVDSFPGSLMPASKEGALERARINFFVETWNAKIGPLYFAILMSPTPEQQETAAQALVDGVAKEIEPLLKNVTPEKPFFGGKENLTYADAIAAPFVLRWYANAKVGEVIPRSLATKLDSLPKFSIWAKAVKTHPSVLKVWPEEEALRGMRRKLEGLRAKHAQQKKE